jgi:hypothetical protein
MPVTATPMISVAALVATQPRTNKVNQSAAVAATMAISTESATVTGL